MHLRAQSACYELKGDLSPVMLKEIKLFSQQFENVKIYKDLYRKPFKRDWMAKVVFLIKILLIFCSHCKGYFWETQLKIYRLPNFNILFHHVVKKFSKSELFLCLFEAYLRKIIMQSHMILKTCKNRLYKQHTRTCIYQGEKTTCCGEVVIVETWPLVRTDLTVLLNPDNSDTKGTYMCTIVLVLSGSLY